MKIISFNCGGLSSVEVSNIKHYLQHNAVHILCVQETRLSGECVRPIPGYHLESKNHVNAAGCVAGGLALYIRHDIQYEVLQAANPLQWMALLLSVSWLLWSILLDKARLH